MRVLLASTLSLAVLARANELLYERDFDGLDFNGLYERDLTERDLDYDLDLEARDAEPEWDFDDLDFYARDAEPDFDDDFEDLFVRDAEPDYDDFEDIFARDAEPDAEQTADFIDWLVARTAEPEPEPEAFYDDDFDGLYAREAKWGFGGSKKTSSPKPSKPSKHSSSSGSGKPSKSDMFSSATSFLGGLGGGQSFTTQQQQPVDKFDTPFFNNDKRRRSLGYYDDDISLFARKGPKVKKPKGGKPNNGNGGGFSMPDTGYAPSISVGASGPVNQHQTLYNQGPPLPMDQNPFFQNRRRSLDYYDEDFGLYARKGPKVKKPKNKPGNNGNGGGFSMPDTGYAPSVSVQASGPVNRHQTLYNQGPPPPMDQNPFFQNRRRSLEHYLARRGQPQSVSISSSTTDFGPLGGFLGFPIGETSSSKTVINGKVAEDKKTVNGKPVKKHRKHKQGQKPKKPKGDGFSLSVEPGTNVNIQNGVVN